MDDDEFQRKSAKAIRESLKVVAQAEQALKKTEDFFRETGISPEQAKRYLETQGDPQIRRETQQMIEQTMREVREDADRAVREAQRSSPQAPPKRRFRNLI